MVKKKRSEWVLVNSTHPRFNRWKRRCKLGESYKECFYKGVNPNKVKSEE